MMTFLSLLLFACWGENAYIVEGTVVSVNSPTEVVLDHKDVPGLMGPMVMPFTLADADMAEGLEPGHTVIARFEIGDDGGKVTKLRVTGKGPAPQMADDGPAPLRVGQQVPAVSMAGHDGKELVIGQGQGVPTVVTFLYTRCPIPEFCPAVVARLQSLQDALEPGKARIVAISLDPEHDTPEVLARFAEQAGAKEGVWWFANLKKADLDDLAMRAALPIHREKGEIVHGLRLWVLDADGEIIERYDDNSWPRERVVQQLLTGEPKAPAGADGTIALPKDFEDHED